jgi:hypothetical protein
LNLLQANQDLAETCLSYLNYIYFDIELLDEDIDEYIKSGVYVLYSFAASQWLPLVQNCAIGLLEGSDIEHLSNHLQEFIEERANPDFEDASAGTAREPYFQKFRDGHPDIYRKLSLIYEFWYSNDQEWSLKNGKYVF